MKPTVLVTGAAGFVGRHLCQYLLAKGWGVAGLALAGQSASPGVETHFGDATDAERVREVVNSVAPRYIVHLAAQSSVAASSGRGGWQTITSNVAASAAILDAVASRPKTRVLLVGSAEAYGAHSAAGGPIPESAALAPLNAYASSKVCQEVLAAQYARAAGVDVVVTRSFNHTGEGQAAHFLVPALVGRARALPSHGGVLAIGNGDVVRDFLDVSDVVRAYTLLLEAGVRGSVYNVSSGVGTTIRDVAQLVLDTLGISASISSEASLRRATDAPYLVGQNERLKTETGWAARSSLASAIQAVAFAPA